MLTIKKRFFAVVLAMVSLVVSVFLVACNDANKPDNQDTETYYSVTFDTDGGSEVTSVRVKENECIAEPTAPAKEGFAFVGWFTNKDCGEDSVYDFATPVTSNCVLYAGWVDASNALCVKFYINDGTDKVYKTVYFEENTRITKPVDPVWENHVFDGWFSDKTCETTFSFNKKQTESISVYAKWRTIYTFEAEYSYIPQDKWGQGYSGQNSGTGLIMSDTEYPTEHKTASNGYYLGWIYYEGATVDFTFTSDRDIDDLTIVFRLSAEYQDCIASNDEIVVRVNGEDHNFPISITGIYDNNTMTTNGRNDFSDYTAATKVSVKKGQNTISLVINNSKQGVGATMNASAPLVDCMYLYTAATLNLDLHTENIK